MPPIAFLTFVCVFVAVSKQLLTPTHQATSSSEATSNVIKIDVPNNISLGDLETLVEFSNTLPIAHRQD